MYSRRSNRVYPWGGSAGLDRDDGTGGQGPLDRAVAVQQVTQFGSQFVQRDGPRGESALQCVQLHHLVCGQGPVVDADFVEGSVQEKISRGCVFTQKVILGRRFQATLGFRSIRGTVEKQ